jgi:ATP-dependent DNA ligase
MASVLADCGSLPRGTILDGELNALSEQDGRPVQDFAAVRRAVFTADIASQRMLRYVAFDVLKVEDQDLRGHSWQERDALLRDIVHDSESIRPIATLPASEAAHAAIVRLGFEGSVLKRPTSLYRSGRHASWHKLKARYTTTVMLRAVHHARDGQLFAVCDLDGRRVTAVAGMSTEEYIGQPIELVYSRLDADGRLSRTAWNFGGGPVTGDYAAATIAASVVGA